MTNHKTIEQWADEYAPINPNDGHTSALEQTAYLAGAAKQKELLMPIIEEMREVLKELNEYTSSNLENLEHYFDNKCCPTIDEVNQCSIADSQLRITLESIEEKLKGLG